MVDVIIVDGGLLPRFLIFEPDYLVDGVDKREFYVAQQKKAADFANKVHAGEITNEAGEKFTTVVQIGIGGSDLGPRALYIALENWAKANNTFKMEAKFISNVDPDDAAAVLTSVDLAHSFSSLYPNPVQPLRH